MPKAPDDKSPTPKSGAKRSSKGGAKKIKKAASPAIGPGPLLFDGPEWDFTKLQRVYDACGEIALGELGLDIYPNQIEVITAEQMLDAYTSIGMPLMYRHWSFGKRFAREEAMYRRGHRSLAYELVINSNPCINYIMEENTMTMQLLVIAHAAYGHNHFFKNNYLFRQWTRADAILDYLDFAKNYVTRCEENYGVERVEQILDWAHALMSHGVHRYVGPRRLSAEESRARSLARAEYEEATFNDLWRTVPTNEEEPTQGRRSGDSVALGLPEENILYFLEKHAPKLEDWQRELLRIVRSVAEYLHPQRQTKVMNEGCATFTHFEILNRLYERGQISEGTMLEFLHSHSSVVFQPSFRDRRFGGMNPYALGFEMMRDIRRMVENPTAEDRDWFPDLAGGGDWMGALREIWSDYRDESFIHQFLSPKLIRDFRFLTLEDDAEDEDMEVSSIHDEVGYRAIRRKLASQYDVAAIDPRIEVVEANLSGNRRLLLRHMVIDDRVLAKTDTELTLQCLANLWGHRVKLLEVCSETDDVLVEHDALPRPN